MENRAIPFRPNLEGQFKERFNNVAQTISLERGSQYIEQIVLQEISWVENECIINLNQRKRYRAIWLLLRDLVRASWEANYRNGVLELRMPSLEYNSETQGDAKILKDRLRSWMQENRVERLLDFSDFVYRMENKDRIVNKGKEPIEKLFAEGPELADRLEKVKKGEISIHDAIQPHFELVEEGSVDQFTGLKLGDIWRYCRLTWSTPSENTPGRTLLYLIRDWAHPYHAIMGIASIENCAVQITCRDEYLKWNATSFIQDLREHQDPAYVRHQFEILQRYIEEAFLGIDITDICTTEELKYPTLELASRLQNVALEQEGLRQRLLKQRENNEYDGMSELGSISLDTEKALYMRKRADQLSKLIVAKIHLSNLLEDTSFEDKWSSFLVTDYGYSAVRTALVAQKTKHIGSSMMELNVCGAIPPYNEILAGKLVALLAVSPQLIADYKNRYQYRKSDIATRLKNEDVIRAADLVYVGTTSLYYVGSSQYNRLKLPSNLWKTKQTIEWKKLGKTIGFGTMHISKATGMSFSEVLSGDKGYNHFNHVFGEGASPKMRLMMSAIRTLLDCSNDDSKDLAKHAMSRIVYGACLAKNATEYLLGYDDKPDYYFDQSDIVGETNKIIDFWLNRWVMSRLNYEPALQRIRSFDRNEFLVSRTIEDENKWTFNPLVDSTSIGRIEGNGNMLEYITQLYRGKSGYSDNVDIDILRKVHVSTDLDEAVLAVLRSGKDVVLTGNAGDGKTHLIRILEEKIKGLRKHPVIELDASTLSNEELYEKWLSAKQAGKPFCTAINGAVLYELNEQYGSLFPPIRNAAIEMLNSVYFDEMPMVSDDVVVFDLSRRNVLSKRVLSDVIHSMCDDSKYEHCEGCPGRAQCDVHRNRRLIQEEIFIERLYAILCRVNLSGFHATVRQLQALIVYMIFGDRDCTELISSSGNSKYMPSELIYTGEGLLFDEIRKSFDPSQISHPHIDEMLVDGLVPKETWVNSYESSNESLDPCNTVAFENTKRKFFFFNSQGDELLKIHNDDVSRFQQFLQLDSKKMVKALIYKLNAFFQTGTGEKELDLWEGFRYSNSPRRVLFSRVSIKFKNLEIIRPKLLGAMASGIDVENNYCMLAYSDNTSIRMKIDFGMFSLLSQAERGIPMLYIDNYYIKQIWQFIEQLANAIQEDEDDDEATIKVLSVQDKQCITVEVDLELEVPQYSNMSIDKNIGRR